LIQDDGAIDNLSQTIYNDDVTVMTKIILPKLKCKRCGHIWFPRSEDAPLRCPRCGSPYWDREKVR